MKFDVEAAIAQLPTPPTDRERERRRKRRQANLVRKTVVNLTKGEDK